MVDHASSTFESLSSFNGGDLFSKYSIWKYIQSILSQLDIGAAITIFFLKYRHKVNLKDLSILLYLKFESEICKHIIILRKKIVNFSLTEINIYHLPSFYFHNNQ